MCGIPATQDEFWEKEWKMSWEGWATLTCESPDFVRWDPEFGKIFKLDKRDTGKRGTLIVSLSFSLRVSSQVPSSISLTEL